MRHGDLHSVRTKLAQSEIQTSKESSREYKSRPRIRETTLQDSFSKHHSRIQYLSVNQMRFVTKKRPSKETLKNLFYVL
jgi:hypothetical protein